MQLDLRLLTLFLSIVLIGPGTNVNAWDECLFPQPLPLDKPLTDLSCVSKLDCKPGSLPQYESYLDDTLQSLEKMRGVNGLVVDTAQIIPGDSAHPATLKTVVADTGPTNIAVDILIQTALAKGDGGGALQARKNLEKVLSTLGQVPFHYTDKKNQHGLFYRLYSTEKPDVSSTKGSLDLSSVDNIHLALALWTASQTLSGKLAKKARKLFDRMDFSAFYDSQTGLAYGNIQYDPNKSPPWQPESTADHPHGWDYGNMGSETRSIYSLGYALGLFRSQANNPDFVPRVMKSIEASRYQSKDGKILSVYDGGGFQVLLPEMLVGESLYSTDLSESANAYAPMILADGKSSGFAVPGKPGAYFPGASSASAAAIKGDPRFHDSPAYIGEEGSPELVVNPQYCDQPFQSRWNALYAPHAAFMAASTSCKNADALAASFTATQDYASGPDHLYTRGIGWADAVWVKPQMDTTGLVVPEVLSLDQGMLALGLLRMKDSHGLGPSADALYSNPQIRARLKQYFKAVDQKLDQSPLTSGIDCSKRSKVPATPK